MTKDRKQLRERCRRKAGIFAMGCLCLMLILMCVGSAAASSAEDYRLRIEHARSIAEELREFSEGGGSESEGELVNSVRNLLPRSEKIALPDGEITIDNEWLDVAITAAEEETEPIRKDQLFAAIIDRLESISEHLSMLKEATERDRSKDEDKQKLTEILARAEFQKAPEPGENWLQKWIREFREWLLQVFPSPSITPGVAAGFGSLRTGLQVLLFLLIFGAVAFVAYKLLPLISVKFRRKDRGSRSDRIILGETIAGSSTTEDLFGEAEGLAREGKLRDALRKGYIAALLELGDRNLIKLARHRTNRDYLGDLRREKELLEQMRHLTGSYERNWYGSRVTEADEWDDFRVRYKRTIASARR